MSNKHYELKEEKAELEFRRKIEQVVDYLYKPTPIPFKDYSKYVRLARDHEADLRSPSVWRPGSLRLQSEWPEKVIELLEIAANQDIEAAKIILSSPLAERLSYAALFNIYKHHHTRLDELFESATSMGKLIYILTAENMQPALKKLESSRDAFSKKILAEYRRQKSEAEAETFTEDQAKVTKRAGDAKPTVPGGKQKVETVKRDEKKIEEKKIEERTEAEKKAAVDLIKATEAKNATKDSLKAGDAKEAVDIADSSSEIKTAPKSQSSSGLFSKFQGPDIKDTTIMTKIVESIKGWEIGDVTVDTESKKPCREIKSGNKCFSISSMGVSTKDQDVDTFVAMLKVFVKAFPNSMPSIAVEKKSEELTKLWEEAWRKAEMPGKLELKGKAELKPDYESPKPGSK